MSRGPAQSRHFHPAPADTVLEGGAGAIETRIAAIGEELASTMSAVIDAVPGSPHGPVGLARVLGLDKVLTSRLLRAARNRDPLAVAHLIPGPEPLRRLLRAAADFGVDPLVIREAEESVERFEGLIRREAGDRSALDAIISTWLPEARQQFEIRRKQSAFKAMSQIKGACADTTLGTVILHPSDDGVHLDVVWVIGLIGLQRLRPGAAVKFASRRMSRDGEPRHPTTLTGAAVESIEGLRLDRYCSDPPAKLDVHATGETVHYTLAGDAFGPRSATDLIFAEANFREMDRYIAQGSDRKGYVFAEVNTPAKSLLFDVFVHEDVYPGSEPSLSIYDTVLDGVASVNDPARDIDRLDMVESIHDLGRGTNRLRVADVPNYVALIREVFETVGWSAERFRGWRCRVEYPIYGSQVAMAFTPPEKPAD